MTQLHVEHLQYISGPPRLFYEGVPSRGGSLWSYRIDDEAAPRRSQYGE